MDVTRDDVLRCARLTGLNLQEAEIEPLRRDMERLLTHAQSLQELDLEGVPPLLHPHVQACPRRPDVVEPSLTQAQALADAPDQDRGCFRVPRAL
ncbi:MAG: Glutamyl-tRNA(Gln) amidotransferase subunit C [Acidobacteria bacterium ADurb.Bin340]|nr:MAG: Glutamyl-tRNA(Gln) amidotransferase subunit C [Acidobacteria bacterium ADurb.Bin340]HOD32088.1 Asp-tRNA(Asn)/Glu-tRNA(Gln) amidotransferase subunit GatC [Holophaga sp.]HQL47075.1 Asp-tRNA(Asn)/Glu-tRNA(Gln) amidotransferase subunit GatC [Holophaga sp.]